MKKIEEIFEDVCDVIENSTGYKKEDINLEDTLFDKLEIDSIDLVDILFELETLYDIELKISDIEQIDTLLNNKFISKIHHHHPQQA